MTQAGSRRYQANLASLDALPPGLEARWMVSHFGREPLFVLSGRFGADRVFCSRYVVFPTLDGSKWIVLTLAGDEDFSHGGLSRLSRQILNQAQTMVEGDPRDVPDQKMVVGAAAEALPAQRLCVEFAAAEARRVGWE